MNHIPVRVTYLQMISPPERTSVAAADGLHVVRARQPSVEFYRELYCAVGGAWNWVDRLLMPDEELRRILQHDRVEVHVLLVDDRPAGYAELDRRVEGEVELAYFGLMPAFIGQGLGRRFLDWAVDRAWSYGPRRVWLHTCELDHPAALSLYRKVGFDEYREEVISQPVSGHFEG